MSVGSWFRCLTLSEILVLHSIVTWLQKLTSPFWYAQLILNSFQLSREFPKLIIHLLLPIGCPFIHEYSTNSLLCTATASITAHGYMTMQTVLFQTNVQNQRWKNLFLSFFFLFLSRENVWTTLCVFACQLSSIHELDTEQPSSEWALCM